MALRFASWTHSADKPRWRGGAKDGIDGVLKEPQSRDYVHWLAPLADRCQDPTGNEEEIG